MRKPNVTITPKEDDPTQQVITFDPPVASWSFAEGHTLDELWKELHQATSALMFDNLEQPFDETMQQKTRTRIMQVLLYWASKKWIEFPAAP